ncbi:hypothetical protein [Actinomadura macra]|uniref:hypothetical protein n=1 Tax=Actinomadura macra TaxID=46164 RepID=UPI00082DEF4E|nr:hypothetical protein [Actinomadura macra]
MISLAGVAAASALVGTASSAAAAPTGCAARQVDGQNYESRCTGGTGEHRVWARQYVPFLGDLDCFGPWVPADSVSRVTCSIHQTVFVTHQTRG